jgi:hypothetical protein
MSKKPVSTSCLHSFVVGADGLEPLPVDGKQAARDGRCRKGRGRVAKALRSGRRRQPLPEKVLQRNSFVKGRLHVRILVRIPVRIPLRFVAHPISHTLRISAYFKLDTNYFSGKLSLLPCSRLKCTKLDTI